MNKEISALAEQAKLKAAQSGVGYSNVISEINGSRIEVSAHKATGHNAYRLNWSVNGRRVSAANLEKSIAGGGA